MPGVCVLFGRGYPPVTFGSIRPPTHSWSGQRMLQYPFELVGIVIHKGAQRPPATAGMTTMQGKALWYVSPGRSELRVEPVRRFQSGEVQVRASSARSAAAPNVLSRSPRAVGASTIGCREPPLHGQKVRFRSREIPAMPPSARWKAGPAELVQGPHCFSLQYQRALFGVHVGQVCGPRRNFAAARRCWHPRRGDPRPPQPGTPTRPWSGRSPSPSWVAS